MKEENQTEEAATVSNPFYLQTNVFSDTTNHYHQFRISRTTDSTQGINQIDIADGLKDSLIEHGFDLETLLDTKPEKTAETLCIDLYVAKLIRIAAMKQYRSRTSESSLLHGSER
jgi:hypothetical protein